MNIKPIFAMLGVALACHWGSLPLGAQTVETVAPVVVKTVPEAGTKDVAPGEVEIKIKFSKEMMPGSFSLSSAWPDSDPQGVGRPRYEADRRTCVHKAKLEPGKTYGIWINSAKFRNFQDSGGSPRCPICSCSRRRINNRRKSGRRVIGEAEPRFGAVLWGSSVGFRRERIAAGASPSA